MERHIKVARVHRGLSWLYGAIAACMAIPAFMARNAPDLGALYAVVVVFGALAVLHHFIGKGARQMKDGARVASLIIGLLMLFGFPVGTIIGIYLLANARDWATDDEEGAADIAHQTDVQLPSK